MYEYTGVIHCHSDYSDGRATYSEVILAARQAGLDYLIMNDHDTLQPLHEGKEGWYGGTFLLIGVEISPATNHYLSLGVVEVPNRNWPAQEYIDFTKRAGGVGFLAHPFDTDCPLLGIPRYDWTDWTVSGFTGMEIWNFLSSWSGLCRGVSSGTRALLRMWHLLPGPSDAAMAKWDELTMTRPVVGIGGVDAHSLRVQLHHLTLTGLTHRQMFDTVRTNLFLDVPMSADREGARRQIIDALRRGRCCIIDAGHGFFRGFFFRGEASRQVYQMGEEAVYSGPVTLTAGLPAAGKIILYRNGQVIRKAQGASFSFAAEERGVYRAEGYREADTVLRPWFISNPIYLR